MKSLKNPGEAPRSPDCIHPRPPLRSAPATVPARDAKGNKGRALRFLEQARKPWLPPQLLAASARHPWPLGNWEGRSSAATREPGDLPSRASPIP